MAPFFTTHRNSPRGAVGALCFALLAMACGPSDDGASDDGEPEGGAGGSGGSGGSTSGTGGILQGLSAALGNSAIALQNIETNDYVFWPEPATDENDEWLATVLGAYDGDQDDGAATGHYRVTQPTGASLDFELAAETSAAPYRAIVGPDWLTIYLRRAGATGFRVDVSCSGVVVDAAGGGEAVVVVGQDVIDTASGSLFCVAAAGRTNEPFSQPTNSFEVEADADGYAVMNYFAVTVGAQSAADGATASASARVHLEFTALP